MRLDHVAYRVRDREKTAQFFMDAFDYKKQIEFEIDLEDGSKAFCIALEPPQRNALNQSGSRKTVLIQSLDNGSGVTDIPYHMAPEIFVSSGPPGSLIDKWVNSWGNGIGGIHHLAYEVDDVELKMLEWKKKGWDFTTDAPLKCDGLTQVFSKPHELTGVIFEFIQRDGQYGFCEGNVAKLMGSTAKLTPKKTD